MLDVFANENRSHYSRGMRNSSDPERQNLTASPQAQGKPLPRCHSQELFKGHTEIEIEHNGALYRLRQTSLGKLILTK